MRANTYEQAKLGSYGPGYSTQSNNIKTYFGYFLTEGSISYAEARLIDGLLEDEVHHGVQILLRGHR